MKDFDSEYFTELAKLGDDGKPMLDAKGEVITERVRVSRNERAQRDRSFRLGGRDFVTRVSVAPETILPWTRMIQGEIDPDEEGALAIYDETVIGFLEPGQDEAWKAVRDQNAEHPINLPDLRALVTWLFEEQTGRPTVPRSPSGSGPTASGTGSTDDSPSPVLAAV